MGKLPFTRLAGYWHKCADIAAAEQGGKDAEMGNSNSNSNSNRAGIERINGIFKVSYSRINKNV